MEAEEPDHVAAEAADVFYFALAKCAKEGQSFISHYMISHLGRQAGRPTNRKCILSATVSVSVQRNCALIR